MKNYLDSIVLLLILVFSTPQLLAADVFEDFNNGNGGFSESTQFYVSDKRLVFKGDRTNTMSDTVWNGGSNPGGWAAKPENSNYFTDFNASVDVIWLAGADNYGYGIRVCSTENRFGNHDYVRFFIANTGYFMIDATIDEDYKELQEWTKSSLITENQYNKLSIAKSGNEFRFYINHTEVKRLVIEGCAGGAIGVEAVNKLDAAFDNFEIKDLSNQPAETTPTTNNENVAELKFIDHKPLYQVGDMLKLNLQAKIIKNRNQRVDLWVYLQMPDGSLFYMTSKITELFSPKSQAYIKSIESIDETYPVLHLQVPEGIGGNYTLSAIFIKEGKNFITGGPTVIKSNIAIAEIVLSDR
jgi:hypothetical protein